MRRARLIDARGERQQPRTRFKEVLKVEGGGEERVHLNDGGEGVAGTRRVPTRDASCAGLKRSPLYFTF
jgi:hypothetical protein